MFIDSDCTVTAHNSTFVNNTAGFGGGAIALFEGTFLDSAHNVFSGNRAGHLGGAIYAYRRSRIIIGNSCYSNNTEEGLFIYIGMVASLWATVPLTTMKQT